MKRTSIFLAVLMLTSVSVWAATPGTPEYERLKEYKKAKRLAKERNVNAPEKKDPTFWDREAERSGLNRMQNPLGFVKNLNPVPFFQTQKEQYEARKASSEKK